MVVSPPCLEIRRRLRSMGLRVMHMRPTALPALSRSVVIVMCPLAAPAFRSLHKQKLMVMFVGLVGHCSYLGIYEVSLESPKAPGGSRGRDATF
jgi:hypothetical protein